MSRIESRVAVVTGGGGVLCSAISRGLAREGTTVVLLDLALDKAEVVVESIRSEGGAGMAIQASVLDRGSLEAAAEKILEVYGSDHGIPVYTARHKSGQSLSGMMVENQNGRIEFISELGEGTAFKIFLPLKRKAAESS